MFNPLHHTDILFNILRYLDPKSLIRFEISQGKVIPSHIHQAQSNSLWFNTFRLRLIITNQYIADLPASRNLMLSSRNPDHSHGLKRKIEYPFSSIHPILHPEFNEKDLIYKSDQNYKSLFKIHYNYTINDVDSISYLTLLTFNETYQYDRNVLIKFKSTVKLVNAEFELMMKINSNRSTKSDIDSKTNTNADNALYTVEGILDRLDHFTSTNSSFLSATRWYKTAKFSSYLVCACRCACLHNLSMKMYNCVLEEVIRIEEEFNLVGINLRLNKNSTRFRMAFLSQFARSLLWNYEKSTAVPKETTVHKTENSINESRCSVI